MKYKLILFSLIGLCMSVQAKPIRVMLLTGQTDQYHRWKVTSAHLKATLDHQGIFLTDEVLFPSGGEALEKFSPDFSKYQVVVLNLNLPEWPAKLKTDFEQYMRNGGGLVIIHEADNAFQNWKEFNLMTGLGGWGGRNEKSGPYYYWKDGQFITDTTPGPGGAHGQRVPFVINVRDSEHPITKGLPTKWLHQNDELYGNLRGPAQNMHVLATAFSTKETGGTGKEEPVLFTVTYGKGRIYHCVLGHTGNDFSDSVEDVGFQVTFSRGTEWAATGKVKQKLPAEFPSETKVLLRDLRSNSTGTTVSIQGDQFYINGKPTYPGRTWKGSKIEGLLMNSRMVQGIFDDANPENVSSFAYPDTKKWDAERNNREFVENMPLWYSYGLNCFTINMQGGSPTGYGVSKCLNTGFKPDGSLLESYMNRLDHILKKADELHMAVILGIFYFGQDQYLADEAAVKNAVKNLINWLFEKGYRNVLIEIANEANIKSYDHDILHPERISELINLVKGMEKNGYRYLVGTSFSGITVPTPNVVRASDFLLIHGNGAKNPSQIQKLADDTRKVEGYRTMPVVINEDDHFDFEKEESNLTTAVKNYISWGYFDFRFPGETDIREGYQTVPVDWGINSERKKAFFNKIKEITGGN
jgi:type 1 glutamine amidotransferase